MPSSSKHTAVRTAAAVLLIAMIAIWSVFQFRLGFNQKEYESIGSSGGGTTLLALTERKEPPDSSYYLEAANVLSKTLFPSNHPGALEAAKRALRMNPLDSRAWMIVARESLFVSNDESAKAALEFSDRLDPHWPRQRLESVRLWTLLDQPERGLATAYQVASLGPEFRVDVAKELLSSGYSPAQVFEQLEVRDKEPIEIANIVDALRTDSLKQMEAIYAHLPESAYKDQAFRRKMFNVAQRPISYSEIIKIWKWESPYLTETSQNWWLDNPELRHPAFQNDFPLGWQDAGLTTEVSLGWRPPDHVSGADGSILLEIPVHGPKTYRYKFYRLIIPAHENVTLRARVKVTPPYESHAIFTCQVKEKWYGDSRTAPTSEDWQDLSIDMPAFEEDVVAELYLQWARTLKGINSSTTSVFIDGIELVPSTASLTPSSFSEAQ